MWRQWLALASLFCLKSRATVYATEGANCSNFQQSVSQNGVDFSFTSLLDNGVGPNGYFRVRMAYPGLSWLGFGVSADGFKMYPGVVMIGQPSLPNNQTNPAVYETSGQAPQFVNQLSLSRQTLLNATIFQNSTHTVLSFTKRLLEFGQFPIHGNGTNRFIYAVGYTNSVNFPPFQVSLAPHQFIGRLTVNFRACINGVPIPPTPSPSALPAATFSPTTSQTSSSTGFTYRPSGSTTLFPTLAFYIGSSVATTANPSAFNISKQTSAPQPSPLAVVSSAPLQVPIMANQSTTSQNLSKQTATEGVGSALSLQSSSTSSFSKFAVMALLWTQAVVASICFI